MAKITIYIPDELYDEMRDSLDGDTNQSRFIQEAVDAKLGPHPDCECGQKMRRSWNYCPTCGKRGENGRNNTQSNSGHGG
jgi:hypothetical protein